jgi:hypothetical protein
VRASTPVVQVKFNINFQLYLDERHLDWMSDLILQHVLSDLRPQSGILVPVESIDLVSLQHPTQVESGGGYSARNDSSVLL